MLALDDQALARLMIAATAVPESKRGKWLKGIAAEFEGPVRSNAKYAAAYRERHRRGHIAIKGLSVNEYYVVGALIASGALTKEESRNPRTVTAAIARHLNAWGKRMAKELADLKE